MHLDRDDALSELRDHLASASGSLLRRMESIQANYDRKIKAGKYDSDLAPKGRLYAVDQAAEEYVTQNLGVWRDVLNRPNVSLASAHRREARRLFPTDVRKIVAKELSDEYEKGLEARGLHFHKDRHLCKSCAKHEKKAMKTELTLRSR